MLTNGDNIRYKKAGREQRMRCFESGDLSVRIIFYSSTEKPKSHNYLGYQGFSWKT